MVRVGLLEKIAFYSHCNVISDLRFSKEWKNGFYKFLCNENITAYSLLEWKDALKYLTKKTVDIQGYKDIYREIDNIYNGSR